MKKWITWIIVAVVLLSASFFLYSKYKSEPEMPVLEPEPAITFETTEETITEELTVKGKADYAEETDVFTPLSANVQQWNVKHGQQVKKGQVLMSLDTSGLVKEVKALEVDIKKAHIEMQLHKASMAMAAETETIDTLVTGEERKKAFIDKESKKLSSRLDEESLSLREEELKYKKAALASATVYAPASGVFLFTDINPKTRALAEGQLIGKVVNTKKLQFVTSVSEQDFFKIKEGMSVQTYMSGQRDKTTIGTITQVSLFPKQATNMDTSQPSQFEVVIALEPSDWLIGGLTLEGQIETQRKEKAVVVPTLAVMRDQAKPYVMVSSSSGNSGNSSNNGSEELEQRIIKTGLEIEDKTEVLEGLRAGETVFLP